MRKKQPEIKVGDRLHFWRFTWEVTRRIEHPSGCVEYKYRVYRKYFKNLIPLLYSNCTYTIFAWRWNFLKEQLEENPKYHYNMSLWSNAPR